MPLEKLGPYKLEKILGRGGMGAVYAGLNEATGERAAVKVLSAHLADDPSFRERFKIEVETLKRLLHPNIVQLFGYGEEDGHLFYVMELVQGRSLQEELAAGRRFGWREVARIGIAVAQALKHAHDRGIIHRDLKPANLLIDSQEHVKLTDFGIAKLYGGSSVTADGGVLGTADFMAPEQAEGKQITSRCDLYALGSVLYALLAGRPPFAGRTIVEVIHALQNDRPIPIRRLAPDTPEAFEDILDQLLEKDPQKRIPTALALSNRLKAMEHALSLETRVGPLPQATDDSEPPPLADSPASASPTPKTTPMQRASGKTAALDKSPGVTAPLDPADGNGDRRAAGDLPTLATSGGSSARSRTAMGTQAGKATGSVHARSTEAAGQANATGSKSAEPAPKATRFTTVSEDELRGQREADDASVRQWVIVGGLAAVAAAVIGMTVFLATRPPTADDLYEAVKQAAEADGGEGLAAVEDELARFAALYAHDPRAAEMSKFQEELDLHRLERSFERRARRGGGAAGLQPVERAYLEAVQLAGANPESALAKFQAILAVFGGPADASLTNSQQRVREQCLELARKQIERLGSTALRLSAEQQAAIREELERADKLAATDRAAAEQIWRGIVTLYGDKDWAEELVAEANEKLSEGTEPAADNKRSDGGRSDGG